MTRLHQHAALPYVVVDGQVHVLLITSRDTGRWVIPKGWPKAKLTPAGLAAREAREEAGVEGDVSPEPIGTYSYRKRLHFFSWPRCDVDVFSLRVSSQRLEWREKGQRRLQWMAPEEAARRVAESDLAALILDFGARTRREPPDQGT